MNWLAQNWIWIALAVGGYFFMTRMGGRGMGRFRRYQGNSDYDYNRRDSIPSVQDNRVSATFDPVSGHTLVGGGTQISTIYHGRAFYFESRENRDAFEATPEKYLANSQMAGTPIGNDGYAQPRHRRRGGC